MMRLQTLSAALVAATVVSCGTPSVALEIQSRPAAVVELFTSQGCASCPPADALLADLGGESDVVALAYHVDYWDYAGWADTFAAPEHTELQRAYLHSWGKSRVYTPQIVINGHRGLVGSHEREVRRALDSADLRVPVTLEAQGDAVQVTVPPQPGAQSAVVWLVPYQQAAEVAVERGENAGRRLTYTHIVVERQAIGMWNPETGFALRIPVSEALDAQSTGAAILIQEKNGDLPGAIVGAAAFTR